MTPDDKKEYDKLEKKIKDLTKKKIIIRNRCKHEKVQTKEYNNLNYKDPLQEEYYWKEFICEDCGITWLGD